MSVRISWWVSCFYFSAIVKLCRIVPRKNLTLRHYLLPWALAITGTHLAQITKEWTTIEQSENTIIGRRLYVWYLTLPIGIKTMLVNLWYKNTIIYLLWRIDCSNVKLSAPWVSILRGTILIHGKLLVQTNW